MKSKKKGVKATREKIIRRYENNHLYQLNLSLLLNGLTSEEEKLYRELQDTVFKDVDPEVADWMKVWMEQFNSRDKTIR